MPAASSPDRDSSLLSRFDLALRVDPKRTRSVIPHRYGPHSCTHVDRKMSSGAANGRRKRAAIRSRDVAGPDVEFSKLSTNVASVSSRRITYPLSRSLRIDAWKFVSRPPRRTIINRDRNKHGAINMSELTFYRKRRR